jgi:hypothetical protein
MSGDVLLIASSLSDLTRAQSFATAILIAALAPSSRMTICLPQGSDSGVS